MSVTFICPACGHGALTEGNCPSCLKARRYVRLRPVESLGAVPLSEVRADTLRRLAVPRFPQIENVMNGGLVPGSVTLLYGGAGLGKSTLCLRLADAVGRVYNRTLYCSTEQTAEQVKMTALRAGVGDSPYVMVAYETTPEAIGYVVEKTRAAFTIVDSLSNLANQEPIAPLTSRLVEMTRSLGTALLLILHETKDGDYNAPRQVEHLVDCMVRLAAHEETGKVMWTVTGKYRFGPINLTAWLTRTAEGVLYDATGP